METPFVFFFVSFFIVSFFLVFISILRLGFFFVLCTIYNICCFFLNLYFKSCDACKNAFRRLKLAQRIAREKKITKFKMQSIRLFDDWTLSSWIAQSQLNLFFFSFRKLFCQTGTRPRDSCRQRFNFLH